MVVFPNKKQNISFHCVNMGSNEWQCYHLNLMDYNVSLCAAVVFLLVCCSRFKVFLFVTYSIIQDEMLVRSGPLNGQCKICNTTQEYIYINICSQLFGPVISWNTKWTGTHMFMMYSFWTCSCNLNVLNIMFMLITLYLSSHHIVTFKNVYI